jgi:hypothetical protein
MITPDNGTGPSLTDVHAALVAHVAVDEAERIVAAAERVAAARLREETHTMLRGLHDRLDAREKQRADAEILASRARARERTKRLQIAAGMLASLVTVAPLIASLYSGGPIAAAVAVVETARAVVDSEDTEDTD